MLFVCAAEYPCVYLFPALFSLVNMRTRYSDPLGLLYDPSSFLPRGS